MYRVQRTQLFDHLAEVIVSINPEKSGEDCANIGRAGRGVLNRIRGSMEERIKTGELEPSYNLLDFVDEGFDSLINDYRISANDLQGMQVAYCTARVLAGVKGLDPGPTFR